ncbi:hypothetical protein EBR21_01265 [bacterium]|nr:hypothetical protein [bacterium]
MEKNDPHSSSQAPSSAATQAQGQRELSLEEIIQLANKIGLEYVDKRRDAERLELLRTTVRARIMNRIESEAGSDVSIPEGRLKRLAEADSEYVQLLEQIAQTRAESEKLRIRYESYRNLFDAKRTMISYKKTELKTL